MTLLTLLLLSLATWRLSSMLVREDGPGRIFYNLRIWVGIAYDDFGQSLIIPERFLPQILSCVWCNSVWVGTGWVIFWLLLPTVATVLAAILAVSALAIGYDTFAAGKRIP